ncbi:hypothetical protein GN156_06230 [bacterium LRH843]|nr:hypothetical protein [bacterium LRH843]
MISFSAADIAGASDWKHYQRGVELLNQGKTTEAIAELERAAAISAKASTLRKLAEAYEKNKQYQKAAETYYREAEVHRKRGDQNTYLAVKAMADALNTEVDLFVTQQGNKAGGQLAKYEPQTGMYIGAYVEQDGLHGGGSKYEQFNQKTGKQHAVFFNYHKYGSPFPKAFATNVQSAGGAVQISLQPENGLAAVKDDKYLRQFAKDAKASGVPIFLRFASEMNGDWVAWHGNPALYKEKFQLVAKVMKEEAPNVAMVWAPNSTPAHNIHQYYPGDHAVDWVGVNLYSVPYFNGNKNEPAESVNPLDLIDVVYNTYAEKKPIMIAEYGASHFTSVGNQDKTAFGQTKMSMFYNGLKMKYPRVKAVHWFSVNTLTAPYVSADRRLNNFSLTSNPRFLDTYKQMINNSYFLSNVVNGPNAAAEASTGQIVDPLQGMTVRKSVTGVGFAKTYDPYIQKVVYLLNGTYLSEAKTYPFAYSLDHSKLKEGTNKLEAVVYDSKGKEAGRKATTFTKGPALKPLKSNQIRLFLGDVQAYTPSGVTRLLVAPFTTEGRTQVPLRFISEQFGATVNWDQATQTVTIKDGKTTIRLKIGSRNVTVNGKTITIDQAPMIQKGTTFVPLRFVSEQLGREVLYTSGVQSIDITK